MVGKMKKIVLLSLLMTAHFCLYAHAAELDRIVAVINDDVVTQSELNHSLSMARVQLSQNHVNLPSDQVLKKQVLDQLINKKLQLQIAKQVGIDVSDEDIDHVVQNVASKNNISTDTLYQRISQDGIERSEYRRELHDQMVVQKLQQQEVGSRLSVTPGEINAFMQSKLWKNNTNKEYRLEDILIPLPDAPSPEQIAAAKKRADRVIAQLHEGQNFNTIAQKESGDSNALKGGDLGWRQLPEIPSAFAEQVVNMHVKEIAGPIQTANGFHIIRLTAERASGSQEATADRSRIEQLIMQRKFEEHVQNWVSKMRSQAFITIQQT
jgi:peptidyl-prolyl cis-trans isomerase SurA